MLISFIFIYSLLFTSLILAVIVSSSLNPTADSKFEIPENYSNLKSNERIFRFHCNECQLFVESRTKHCKECNRYVSEFDHHCYWINNCIGKNNYKFFLIIICSLFALCIFTVCANSYLIYYFSSNNGLSNLESFYVINSKIANWILNGISLLISIVLGSYTSYLIILHIYLIKNGMTTHEYSMKLRNENIDKILNQKKRVL